MQTMIRTTTLQPDDLRAFGATRGAEGHLGHSLPPAMRFSLSYWIDAYSCSSLHLPVGEQQRTASATAERIIEFKARTGLTWPQVARLFGVSKRAVMLWRSGGQMAAVHEERLTELLSRLRRAPSDNSTEMRTWLMTIDEHGTAPYQRWVEEAASRKREPWIDRQPTPR